MASHEVISAKDEADDLIARICSREMLTTLRDEGLVRVPGLVSRDLVDRARSAIDSHLHQFSDENEDEESSLGEVLLILAVS